MWNDPKGAQDVMRERRRLEQAIGATRAIESDLQDTVELIEMAESEGDDALVDDGVKALAAMAEKAEKDKVAALLAGEADANNTYVEINAGAGGTESQDWAEMLLRMYLRWSERRGFRREVMDYQPGDEAGIKSTTILLNGDHAFGLMAARTKKERAAIIAGVARFVEPLPYPEYLSLDASARVA